MITNRCDDDHRCRDLNMRILLTRFAIFAVLARFGALCKIEEVQLFNNNVTFGQRTLQQATGSGDFGEVRIDRGWFSRTTNENERKRMKTSSTQNTAHSDDQLGDGSQVLPTGNGRPAAWKARYDPRYEDSYVARGLPRFAPERQRVSRFYSLTT